MLNTFSSPITAIVVMTRAIGKWLSLILGLELTKVGAKPLGRILSTTRSKDSTDLCSGSPEYTVLIQLGLREPLNNGVVCG